MLQSVFVAIAHGHEDQRRKQDDEKTERARNAIPCTRHPHTEPFAADHDETDLIEARAKRQTGEGDVLGALKSDCCRRSPPPHPPGTEPAQACRQRLRRDNRAICQVMQPGRNDRTIANRRVGKDRIHRQYVANELEICVVVGKVVEYEKAEQQAHRPDAHDFQCT